MECQQSSIRRPPAYILFIFHLHTYSLYVYVSQQMASTSVAKGNFMDRETKQSGLMSGFRRAVIAACTLSAAMLITG